MFFDHQLKINFGSGEKNTVDADEVKRRRTVEEDEQKPLTREELAKKNEADYWAKVDQIDQATQEKEREIAQRNIERLLKTIEKARGKIVSPDIKSSSESDEVYRPYEDIYPYARNFRKKR